MKNLVIFGLVNLVAATLSGASGGGGGLISTPLLATLGLSPATAIATAKFGGFGISAGCSLRFFREKMTDRRTVIIFSIMSAVGALLGSLLLVRFSDQQQFLEKAMGSIILFVGVPMLYIKNMGIVAKRRPYYVKVIGAVLMGVVILLTAAFGSGVGSLQLILLMSCFGMTALVASATRRAMQLVIATISLIVFMTAGLVDYKFGLVGLVTSFIGGFLGAHIAVKKGDKFVVNLFAITSVILALQLIFG